MSVYKRKVTNEQRKKLRKLIFEKGRNEGGLIDNEEVSVRKKLRGFASRTIGRYSESDGNITAIGIEGAFHDVIAGKPGKLIVQKLKLQDGRKLGNMRSRAVSGVTWC